MKHSDCTAYSEHVVELAFAVEFDRFVGVEHEDVGGNDPCKLLRKIILIKKILNIKKFYIFTAILTHVIRTVMMTSESLRTQSHLPHIRVMMLGYHCIHIIHIIGIMMLLLIRVL